jgi:hypothetical protein
MGWAKFGDETLCKACRGDAFVRRSVVLPVWSVEPNKGEGTDKAKHRFYTAFRESSRWSAQVGTWVIREMAKADNLPIKHTVGKDGKSKATMEKINIDQWLRDGSRELAGKLDSQSRYSVIRLAMGKYNKTRFDQRVRLNVQLPSYKFPAPIPIPSKDSKIWIADDGNLYIDVRIGGEHFVLRMARGQEFHRQHSQIRQALNGCGRIGDLLITSRLKDGGGLDKIKVVIPVEIPIVARERKNLMIVKTAKGRLWSVMLEGRDVTWNMNEDQVLGVIAANKRRRQRLSEDAKFERRGSPGLQKVRDRMAEKYANRMADYCHKAAKMLVDFAVRNQVANLQYHETDDKFVSEFPWFKLRENVKNGLKANGITFELISDSAESAVA